MCLQARFATEQREVQHSTIRPQAASRVAASPPFSGDAGSIRRRAMDSDIIYYFRPSIFMVAKPHQELFVRSGIDFLYIYLTNLFLNESSRGITACWGTDRACRLGDPAEVGAAVFSARPTVTLVSCCTRRSEAQSPSRQILPWTTKTTHT